MAIIFIKKQMAHFRPIFRGLFAVNKPVGPSSNQVVQTLRRILGPKSLWKKLKIGHAGTLDPLASGVLVIGVGPSCKDLHFLHTNDKAYIARGKFGFETDTLDMDKDAKVIKTSDNKPTSREQIEAVLPQFRGKIKQTPPAYSAVWSEGKRLYQRARSGEEVKPEPRDVEIHKLDLLDFNPTEGTFQIYILSAKGMYVRSLVADIGRSLNSCATTIELQRVKQGDFKLEQCLNESEWNMESIRQAIEREQKTNPSVIKLQSNNT